jgi:HEXXH motif-containing protein
MSPRESLWADTRCHHQRLEKSAVALIAIVRELSANRSLVGGIEEFLRLYRRVEGADPDKFTRVWSDPVAYYWVRRTVHFLASCHGEPLTRIEREYCAAVGVDNPRDALMIHLREFKRFALALGAISRTDLSFCEPYRPQLPLALPASRIVLLGSGLATIQGVSNGSIELGNPARRLPLTDAANDAKTGIRIEACPVVNVADASVFLNPVRFRLPGIGLPLGCTELSLDFQSRHAPLVAEALRAISRFQPTTFAGMTVALHTIALKPNDGNFFNVSASELPGAFVCVVPTDPYLLASTFIHEFHHNTLFCIEEDGPFFAAGEQDEVEGENHYSPWVDTPRPLQGILHAVYVFVPVFRYWCSVLRDGKLDEARTAYAREQIARIPVQLRIGINQLRRHGRFTALGSSIVEALAREVSEAEQQAQSMSASLKTPVMAMSGSGSLRPFLRAGRAVTVAETLLEHLMNSDFRGECTAEKDLLVRTLGA